MQIDFPTFQEYISDVKLSGNWECVKTPVGYIYMVRNILYAAVRFDGQLILHKLEPWLNVMNNRKSFNFLNFEEAHKFLYKLDGPGIMISQMNALNMRNVDIIKGSFIDRDH